MGCAKGVKHDRRLSMGEVVKLHKIDGLPAIVEYKVGPEFENAGKVEFHVAGLNCSYDSLDEALLGLCVISTAAKKPCRMS